LLQVEVLTLDRAKSPGSVGCAQLGAAAILRSSRARFWWSNCKLTLFFESQQKKKFGFLVCVILVQGDESSACVGNPGSDRVRSSSAQLCP